MEVCFSVKWSFLSNILLFFLSAQNKGTEPIKRAHLVRPALSVWFPNQANRSW